MCPLGRRRRLEAVHIDTLGINTAPDVLDRAVLAGRVDRLKNDQQRPVGLGEEAVLQIHQHGLRVSQGRGTAVLAQLFVVAAGIEFLSQIYIGTPALPG